MKRLILIFSLLFSTLALSQTSDSVFDDEWYEKLDSKLEYIAFPNPSSGELSIRVYRGVSEEHLFTLRNSVGQISFTQQFGKECDFILPELKPGIYFITVSNSLTELNQKLYIK
jgi:hypothetical protein